VRAAFEPLEQGRPWLVWQFAPAGWWPDHALLIARCLATGAGLVTMVALGSLLEAVAGRRAALVGMWLWAVLPIAVWHERLALQDPLVTTLLAGALACAVRGLRPEAKRPDAWHAAGGLLFGAAAMLKISAVLALPWLALAWVGCTRYFGRPLPLRSLAIGGVAALLPLLSLGGEVFALGSKLGRYNALPSMQHDATAGLLGRMESWFGWYAGYGGWPLLALLLGAVAAAVARRHSLAAWLGAGVVLSFATGAAVFNNSHARYTLPEHVPLVCFLALSMSVLPAGKAWRRGAAALTAAVLLAWCVVASGIGTDPATARVPAKDIVQYVTGPWSGNGLGALEAWLVDRARATRRPVAVITHRHLRPGCYGLMLASLRNSGIQVVPFTIYEPGELAVARAGIAQAAARLGLSPEIFLLYEGSIYPAHPWLDAPGSPVSRELMVDRGGGESFTLYRVKD
jgi:hypothetical protein